MVDASASKNPKRTNTQKDKEDMMSKTTFFSKVKRISDTNINTVNMVKLKDRLKEGRSPMAKNIYKSGIVHAAAYPPTLPCSELIMECASRLDIVTKSIIFYEGKRVLASINGKWSKKYSIFPNKKA